MTREERRKATAELKALDAKLEKLDRRINPLRDRLSRLEDIRQDLIIDIGILVDDLWPQKKKPKLSTKSNHSGTDGGAGITDALKKIYQEVPPTDDQLS